MDPILGSSAIANNEILVCLSRKRLIQNGPPQRLAKLYMNSVEKEAIQDIYPDQTYFGQTNFDETNFGRTNFDETNLGQTNNERTNFGQTNFDRTKFGRTNFDQPKFGQTNFDQKNFGKTNFGQTNYDKTDKEQEQIGTTKEDSFFAYSLENYTFKGKSETIIDLEVKNLKSQKNLFYEKSQIPGSKLEMIQTFQTVTPENPIFRLIVINPVNSTVRIPRGTCFIELSEIYEIANLKSTEKNVEAVLEHVKIGSLSSKDKKRLHDLLISYAFLFQGDDDILPETNLEKFKIETTNEHAICSQPYRTPLALRDEMKRILDSFLEQNIIERVNSPYNSPCLLVKKRNGSFRLVVDFRRINSVTKQQHHPIQQIEDVLSYLEGSTIFSCVDLRKGFHQVVVEEESKLKLAFSTEYGQFSWNKMPMGCKNAPSHFAKCIDLIFQDCPKTEICAYLDDLVVHSQTIEEHFSNLEKFFLILAQNNLRINVKKAAFFESKANILGYVVSEGSVSPSPEKIETIRNLQIPKNRDEALSLFGLLSQHRKFIKNFAPLGLHISRTYRGTFAWTDEASCALEELKNLICNFALKLKIPPLNSAVFVLETDASQSSFGGVLSLCIENNDDHTHNANCLRPCAYHSLNFNPTQTKYNILEKELLAGKLCMERWRHFLSYVEFRWITDNSCVKHASTFRTNNLKIQRWLAELQGFSFKLEQRKSAHMKISDFLSRNPALPAISKLSFSEADFVNYQKCDPVLSQVRNFVSIDRWPNVPEKEIIPYIFHRSDLEILHSGELILNCNTGERKLVGPKFLIPEIIKEYHDHSHFGMDITINRISSKYFWPSLRQTVRDYIRSCHYCQTCKPNNHPNRPPLGKFKTPEGPFEMLAFDLIGPLSATDARNVHIMTIIDLFSKKCYAIPLTNKKSGYLLNKFKTVLFQNPKFPRVVLMDNAPEFNAISKYLVENGIRAHFIPPRHPETNGQVENMNRTLKARLRAKCNFVNWDKVLPQVVHELNSSVHSVLGVSPFFIETGISDAHEFHDPNWREYGNNSAVDFEKFRNKITEERAKRCEKFRNDRFKEYNLGEKVLIRNFRGNFPKYIGPFSIIKKSPAATWYVCDDQNGKKFSRHADDIKAYIERVIDETDAKESISKLVEKRQKVEDNVIDTEIFEEELNFYNYHNDDAENSSSNEYFSENRKIGLTKIPKKNLGLTTFTETNFGQTTFTKTNFGQTKLIDDVDLLAKSCRKSQNSPGKIDEDRSENDFFSQETPENLTARLDLSKVRKQLFPNDENQDGTLSIIEMTDEITLNNDIEIFSDGVDLPEQPKVLETPSIPNLSHEALISYDKLSESVTGLKERAVGKRSREKSDDSITSRKVAKFTVENDLENMSIIVKFPEDDQELFDRIENDWERKEYGENMEIEKGLFLNLGDLTKDTLMYILFKANERFSKSDNCNSLRKKVRKAINSKYPNWRRSKSNKLLFYAHFRVLKERSLFDLSLPELRTLCAAYKLPKFPSCSKTILTHYIEEQFSRLYPNHPKKNNELIFKPEIETEI